MKKRKKKEQEEEALESQSPEAEFHLPFKPIPIPWIRSVSGLYRSGLRRTVSAAGEGDAESTAFPGPIPIRRYREELRLDVDGNYPQMVASGLIQLSIFSRVHWIANLRTVLPNTWKGPITYRDGAVSIFPYTNVRIDVVRPSIFSPPVKAKITFSGGGAPNRVRILRYSSPYFHPVEFEFDAAHGTTPVTRIGTHDHPNRPGGLPDETLSIETVFRRSGFAVRKSGGDDIVPLAMAGADNQWSDMEMHDAMQSYWSRFANRAQWSLWVLFASMHEWGSGLGGIMFDDIGPNERQGTALFLDSFISQPPAGDPNPAAWVRRMIFWTACHEMGHAFNLAHSWQKSLTVGGRGPWIPLSDEPEARSFMNYPFRVTGGQTAFFGDFEYRFSDPELLFMRHAPGRFVQMGNADWFDDHGFRQANTAQEPACRLELRVNRPKPYFEFLEPISLELKLKNVSTQPQILPSDLLSTLDHLTLIVKREGMPARQFSPFARYCRQHELSSLDPGNSMYDSVFVSSGRGGWLLDEPGKYTLQAALHFEEEDIVSSPLKVRIGPPESREEEVLAQDYFSDDVGRILAFDGSRFLTDGNDTLREIADRLPKRRVARHAHVALGNAVARASKQLNFTEEERHLRPAHMAGAKVKVLAAQAKEAKKHLSVALTDEMEESAESLGHIDCKYYVDRFTEWLVEQGDRQEASKILKELHKVLAARGVLDRVLREIKTRSDKLAAARGAASR